MCIKNSGKLLLEKSSSANENATTPEDFHAFALFLLEEEDPYTAALLEDIDTRLTCLEEDLKSSVHSILKEMLRRSRNL